MVFLVSINGACLQSTGNKKKFTESNSENSSVVAEKNAKREFPADWRNFKKPSKEKLKAMLTPMEYKISQEDGTEPPFNNEIWDNKRAGIYVDVVSGEPLFLSNTKFKSGTGWPSFYQPINRDFLKTSTDYKAGYPRSEVRSKIANSHLGHVFDDGPKPTGLRYCINSAALRFIPKERMKELGYEKFLSKLNAKPH